MSINMNGPVTINRSAMFIHFIVPNKPQVDIIPVYVAGNRTLIRLDASLNQGVSKDHILEN